MTNYDHDHATSTKQRGEKMCNSGKKQRMTTKTKQTPQLVRTKLTKTWMQMHAISSVNNTFQITS